MDRFLSGLALVTLVEMMIYVGLSASVADVIRTLKDRSLIARAALANYILVPLITIALLALFHATPMVSVGFLLLAVCPGGAYGAPYTAIAKGSVGEAAGLMIVLAGSSAILSPILLKLLLPFVTGAEAVRFDIGRVMAILFFGQILPLVGGLALQCHFPHFAATLLPSFKVGAKILNIIFLACVFYLQFDSLLLIRFNGFIGMLILLSASFAIGWFCGTGEKASRKSMTLITGMRNNGVGMVIATSAFAGTAAVSATVVYGIIGLLGGLSLALIWGGGVKRTAQLAC